MKIYRSAVEIYDVEITESTVLTKRLMGIDVIKASFESTTMLDLRTNDYIVFKGVNYKINQLPEPVKTSTRGFAYTVNFEGLQYEMSECSFLNAGRPDIPLYTNADTMVAAVVANLNRLNPATWSKTVAPATEFKSLTFGSDNCLSALNKICKEFSLEWYLIGHQINVVTAVGNATGLTFEYKAGLKNIARLNANKGNIVTRLYPFGGTQNIDVTYRSGLGRLGLNAPVENNVSLYGTKEGTLLYEDVFPQRTGTVTSASDREFIDTSMDFDLNSYLIPGVVAKVIFKSGYLAGYIFDLKTYVHATKTFTLLYYKDPAGFSLPNVTQVIQAGDTYTLVDIKMPTSYITAAETTLNNRALVDIAKISVPRVTYRILPDWRYFKLNTISLEIGDTITVHDTDMSSTDIVTRITEFTQVIVSPYKYTISVSDEITYSIAESLLSGQRNINNLIRLAGLQDAVRSRANWLDTQSLRNAIFDPDDYFNMENIRPASVETLMLTTGSKGAQFILKDVEFKPNYEGSKAKLVITAGSLIHLTIDSTGIKTWVISAYNTSALEDAKSYYIYVKASKSVYTATWEVTETQYNTNPAGNYYYFLVGFLHLPTTNNMRRISLTYGSTNITGEFITTGKISSTDGNTYFDLQNGEIGGKIKFQSGHYDNEVEADVVEALSTANEAEATADAAQSTATAAQSTANTAASNATAALTELSGIINDNVLSKNEKPVVKLDYDVIIAEKSGIDAKATEYGITTEKTAYDDAVTALTNYIVALSPAYTNFAADTVITGTTFRAKFQDVYTTRQTLLDKIYSQAKVLADAAAAAAAVADAKAVTAQTNLNKLKHFTAQPTTPYYVGNTWFDGTNLNICKVERLTGAFVATDWQISIQPTFTGQVFTSEPTTPYHIGDMWTTGVYLYVCIVERLTGVFNPADWTLATRTGSRVFIVTPTTPYDLGDMWTNGSNLYYCIHAKATGSYDPADWVLATYYDRTQTIIDGGVITTGRIEVGGGVLGLGNAGMNGSVSGSPTTDIRFWAGDTFENRATADFRVQDDGKVIATYGLIGGWTLAGDAIYTGTKHITNGFSTMGVTFAADGSIHAPTFYINSSGEIGLAGISSISLMAITGAGLKFEGVDIFEPLYNGDGVYGCVYVNMKGYLGGFTKYRDFVLGDGKFSKLLEVTGSSRLFNFYGGRMIFRDLATYENNNNVLLDLQSTTRAFKPPRMTTAQRNAITKSIGMIVYDTTLNNFCGVINNGGTLQWWNFWMHSAV